LCGGGEAEQVLLRIAVVKANDDAGCSAFVERLVELGRLVPLDSENGEVARGEDGFNAFEPACFDKFGGAVATAEKIRHKAAHIEIEFIVIREAFPAGDADELTE
jgi:hypothetical protein